MIYKIFIIIFKFKLKLYKIFFFLSVHVIKHTPLHYNFLR